MNTLSIALLAFAAVCAFPSCYAVPLANNYYGDYLLGYNALGGVRLPWSSGLSWIDPCLSPLANSALNSGALVVPTTTATLLPSSPLSLPIVDPCLNGENVVLQVQLQNNKNMGQKILC